MLRSKILALTTALAVTISGIAASSPASAQAGQVAVSTANFSGSSLDKANRQQIIDVFNGINKLRKAKRLNPVRFNVTVSEMAEDWSVKMSKGRFEHNPHFADDSRVAERWSRAGEIIAFNGSKNGNELVNMWRNSPGHYSIIMDPNFTEIGVGIHMSGSRTYGTVNFFSWFPSMAPRGSYKSPEAFLGKPSAKKKVTPVKPTFNAVKNTVKIPKKTGVAYYVNGKKKAAGTYKYKGKGTVTAKASSGSYTLSGTKSWNFDNRNSVKASKPSFNAVKNTVKIPKKTGVAYYVNGKKKAAGTYKYKGKGTVTAKASSGSYKLSGTKSWKYNNGR